MTRRLPAALLLALVAIPGCSRRDPTDEPLLGLTWKPMLIASADAFRVPPPPTPETAEARADLETRARPRTHRAAAPRSDRVSVRWNERARTLVARHRTNPAMASRAYALVSVAQYDTLVITANNQRSYRRRPEGAPALPDRNADESQPTYPSARAAVATASAVVLGHLYPEEVAALQAQVAEEDAALLDDARELPSGITAGEGLGREVAEVVIRHAETDHASAAAEGAVTRNEGRWTSAPNHDPVLPLWGQVTPWLMSAGAQFRAPPPPPFGSAEYQQALTELKTISETRTREQARIAALWADGLGSYAPAGRWNKVAADLIAKHDLGELRAARVLALLNVALMDAGIACWESKYHYLLIRPSQADPSISTPVGLPNFPAYTSAHAAFSGAAAELLGLLFPDERAQLRAKAEEAALSRVYGGIHYRFDGEAGLLQGQSVARLAWKRAQSDELPTTQ